MSLPPKRELEGKSLIDMKDQNGVYLVKELLAKANEGWRLCDLCLAKPPKNDVVEKLSYARLIPGTKYMIGTGVYIDDIGAKQAQRL